MLPHFAEAFEGSGKDYPRDDQRAKNDRDEPGLRGAAQVVPGVHELPTAEPTEKAGLVVHSSSPSVVSLRNTSSSEPAKSACRRNDSRVPQPISLPRSMMPMRSASSWAMSNEWVE